MTEIKPILRKHQLRHTRSRTDILQVFLDKDAALSEREIEKAIEGSCDRVTIYRTLATFLDKGLIHKVLDNTGAMKFALCNQNCEDGKHNHEHVHFKCVECGQTHCLDEVPIPAMSLPEGYTLSEVNVLMEGTCPRCKK